MVHSKKIISSASSGALPSQSCKERRNGKTVSATNEENSTHEKKEPGSFFTKRTAMLFFVAAYIFLKHQHDFAKQNGAAIVQVGNRVARNLAMNKQHGPSEEELELEEMELSQGGYPYKGYEDPYEGYEDPYEDYEDPYEDYEDPYEAYEDPEEAYGNPEEGYEDPYEAYGDPYEGYHPYKTYGNPYETYEYDEGPYECDEEEYSDEELQVEHETAGHALKVEQDIMDESKYADLNTFLQSLEDEWVKLELKLFDARENWIEEKNKEFSKWVNVILSKWMKYSGISTTGSHPDASRKLDWNNDTWKKWFNEKVKSEIDLKLEKWLDEKHSDFFNIFVKNMGLFKSKKIKGWLMYHWKMNEGGYRCKSYERMATPELVNLVKSRRWYHANPNIDKQRKELMEWFLLKEKECIKQEQVTWSKWESVQRSTINSMCTTFSGKRLTEAEWDKFLCEI
ncbi:Blood-stage membrane protein [Plasmodium coatneyi]|uniref:Blood-stage membrane protein n=1 Tax=Plasmodium coatneyi TaxID=208452 RepID=A0A1B1E6P6_9APIC|nr:Blood-stage membrane protein [Plasmodium coatneyi]ANQ10620.1 Blood-stage membrane protein [Plasmodium coatneyi]